MSRKNELIMSPSDNHNKCPNYSQPSVIVSPSSHCPPFDPTPLILLTFLYLFILFLFVVLFTSEDLFIYVLYCTKSEFYLLSLFDSDKIKSEKSS